MRIVLILPLLLLLLACSEQTQPEAPLQSPSVPPAPVQTATPEKPIIEPTDPCRINPSEYLLYKEKDGNVIALKSISLVDRGTFYKVMNATIYAKPAIWYNNDVTVQFSQENSGLMEFNRKLVPIDANADNRCFIGTIPLNISLRNLSMDYATVMLGQGRDRNGRQLVIAEGRISLQP
jgi:hypothetical protein